MSWSLSPPRLAFRTLTLQHDILPSFCPRTRNIHITPPKSAASTSDDIRWPTTPNPSPYEILGLPQTASSSEIKARYYLLAKLYHPDSRGRPGETPHLRLHRFRQVVQANELLSTARRRRIYDSQGYGWDDMNFNDVMSDPIYWKGTWEGRFRATGSPPRQPKDPWETFRWDDLRPSWEKAQPYYTSNANFAGAIIVLMVFFGVLEFGHVQSKAEKTVEARKLVHERASANLRDARSNAKTRRDMIEDIQQRRHGVSGADMETKFNEPVKR